jgi:hypothetical protein
MDMPARAGGEGRDAGVADGDKPAGALAVGDDPVDGGAGRP